MQLSGRIGLALLALALAGCGGTPPAEVSPSPNGSPLPTDTPLPPVSPTPSAASPSPAPTPTTEVTNSPPVEPTASPTVSPPPPEGAWTGPTRISERLYDEPTLVIDGAGVVHMAARLDNGIFYVTNASGSWTRERVSRPPRRNADGQPSIAIDRNGTLWIAFTRLLDTELGRFPLEIHLINNSTGAWSIPQLLVRDGANSPALKVRDGRIYLAFVQGAPSDVIDDEATFPLMYGTDHGGSFATEEIASNGAFPKLELDADGRPHVIYGSPFWVEDGGAGYAVGAGPGGGFSVETLPAAVGNVRNISLAIDSGGGVHALWSSWPEDAPRPSILHARRGGGGWSGATLVLDNAWGTAISAGPAGSLHGVALGESGGVWYITNRTGSLAAEQLSSQTGQQPAIAVDGAGRPHLVFLGGESGSLAEGLWYAVGPAN